MINMMPVTATDTVIESFNTLIDSIFRYFPHCD